MKLATKIFKRSDWYVTSPFGWRIHPITKKRTFHNGCDYGTNVQKWPQYAIEDGYVNEVVISKAKTGYGTYIWVRYPRINRSLLHAHLDSVVVKKGDKVKEGTLLGYTGKTGSATGIHLHLGMTEIGKQTWLDPDAYDYQPAPEPEPTPTPTPTPSIKPGDSVIVNGRGYASSNGKGRSTKKYVNKKMKVILINKGAKCPYALNQYNTGKVGSAAAVTAWFSEDEVKKV